MLDVQTVREKCEVIREIETKDLIIVLTENTLYVFLKDTRVKLFSMPPSYLGQICQIIP